MSEREELLEKIREKVRRDPYANLLGIEVLELREGYAKASLIVRDDMVNFHGVAHGGLIASLADVTFAAASNSRNKKALALNLNVSYRRPVKAGETIIAEAFEESLGDTTALYRIVVKNSKGSLVAVCQGLVYRMNEPVA
ncbi:MAG: hotdog fold thioesterase [Candidatus Nezhaarchaeales archaeon]